MSFISQHLQQPVGQMPTQIRFQIQDRVRPMIRQGGMKQAARDWLNRTDATGMGYWMERTKADQGFYSLAKRAHYIASIIEAKAMHLKPKSILIKEWMGSRPGLYCVSYIYFTPHVLLYSYIWIPSLSFPFSACWHLFPLDYSWMEVSFPKSQIMSFIESP